jgi:hypothetical protein
MSRRRSRRRVLLVILAVTGVVLLLMLLLRPPVTDDTEANAQFDTTIAAWADKSKLAHNLARYSRAEKSDRTRRWLRVERAYWVPPHRRRSVLLRDLGKLASAHGLKLRTDGGGSGETEAVFLNGSGNEIMRLSLRNQAFVAIVIDDLGYSMEKARRVAALPCRLTCSVMPFTPSARAVARLAAASGKEVFIHMPMQPTYPLPSVPEYSIVLRSGQSYDEVERRIQRACGCIPGAAGMNNHEGSVATEDRVLMAYVMTALKKRALVFLDSATTSRTLAWRVAKESGVPWARRQVFLDSERDPASVDKAFTGLVARAHSRGRAIAIGHPYPVTLDTLERRVPEAIRQGAEFVFVSSLTRVY